MIDYNDMQALDWLARDAQADLGGLTVLLVAHGQLTDQPRAETDGRYLADQIYVNLSTAIVVISHVATMFDSSNGGSIIVLGSVAGDRGRRRNYAYGAAKSGLATFCEGVRTRLSSVGGRVLVVKPGLVDTPMTAHLPKNVLYTSPDRVAADALRGLERGRSVVYSPWFWRYIMLAIRLIPTPLFHRLRL